MTRTNLPPRGPSQIYDDPRQFRPKLEIPAKNVSDNQQPQNTTSESSFHLFPKLPLELRLKIWEYTLPGPRLVPIAAPPGGSYTSPAPLPLALHMSRESRSVALKKYSLQFARKMPTYQTPFPAPVTPHEPRIYFNFHDDVVYLRHDGDALFEARLKASRFAYDIAVQERERIRAVCWDMNVLPKDVLSGRRGDLPEGRLGPWGKAEIMYVSMESEACPLDSKESCGMWELEERRYARFEDLFSGRAAARRRGYQVNPGSFVVGTRMEQIREGLRAYFWPGESGQVGKEVRFVVVTNDGKEPVDRLLVE